MSDHNIWITILGLGAITFIMRASFIVFLGDREMPLIFKRHLRYVAVAILPGMISTLILFPTSLGGVTNFVWIGASFIAVLTGFFYKNPLVIMIAGALTYIILSAWPLFEIPF